MCFQKDGDFGPVIKIRCNKEARDAFRHQVQWTLKCVIGEWDSGDVTYSADPWGISGLTSSSRKWGYFKLLFKSNGRLIYILITTFSFDSTEFLHLFFPNIETGTNSNLLVNIFAPSSFLSRISLISFSISFFKDLTRWDSSNQVGIDFGNKAWRRDNFRHVACYYPIIFECTFSLIL